MGNKIPESTGIFDDVDHPKSRGVTHWAERIGPLVDHIIQFSCCTAFGAIQKNRMLFFEYFKIGCMYLDNFFLIWKVWSGAMLVTIFRTVTSITAFSVTKKPQKSRKKAKLSWGNTNGQLENLFSRVHQDVHLCAKASVPGAYDFNRLSLLDKVARIKMLLNDDNFLYRKVDVDTLDESGKVCDNTMLTTITNLFISAWGWQAIRSHCSTWHHPQFRIWWSWFPRCTTTCTFQPPPATTHGVGLYSGKSVQCLNVKLVLMFITGAPCPQGMGNGSLQANQVLSWQPQASLWLHSCIYTEPHCWSVCSWASRCVRVYPQARPASGMHWCRSNTSPDYHSLIAALAPLCPSAHSLSFTCSSKIHCFVLLVVVSFANVIVFVPLSF